MTIRVEPLNAGLGAAIYGADVTGSSADSHFETIRSAFIDHGVVFVRGLELTPDEHVAFAARFGPINVNRFFKPVDGHPQVAQVLKEPDHKQNIGGNWHTDHSYDQIPALGSLLYALELPETGGDTLFTSMYRALDSMSDGLKATLAGLRANHSSRHTFGDTSRRTPDMSNRIGNPELATQDAIHPVIIKHPLSGRPALYVNPSFTTGIDGWTPEESQVLLQHLYKQALRPENTCRWRWERGDLAIWDNRCTWHHALNDYHGQRRYMHRVTVEGVPLEEGWSLAA